MIVLAGLVAVAEPAGAPPRDPVVAFVAGLYRYLPTVDQYAAPFTPKLAALVRRDRAYAKASGGAGALAHMPLCDCTAFDGYGLTSIRGSGTKDSARAEIVFHNAGANVRVTVELVRGAGGYAIADIGTATVPSLARMLAREVPREEAILGTAKPQG